MTPPWLFLFHHIPQHPNYLRVRIGRLVRSMGAVAMKNSVYALPDTPQSRAAFEQVASEVMAAGGEAVLVEAKLLAGLTDADLVESFHAVREAAFLAIAAKARELAQLRRAAGTPSRRWGRNISQLEIQLKREVALDFFGAPGRAEAKGRLDELAAGYTPKTEGLEEVAALHRNRVRGKTWVTRQGVLADRIASAWLIRRFIDPEARFRFVTGAQARTSAGELRFDMPGGEFTHEGDRCTFETLVARFALADPALEQIAEIIHDIDLKDHKFGRSEAPGLERLIFGLAASRRQDSDRLKEGAALLEALYHSFLQARA